MNERIQELAEQAGFGIAGNPEYIHAMDYDGMCTDELEKFARLIVKECVNVARSTDDDDGAEYTSGRIWAGNDILTHFGIEK
jgi:hypothetical protein